MVSPMSNKFNFFVPKDKKECEYIGFNLEREKSSFIFPCQYFQENELSDNEKKKEAKKIIALLKRIQQEYLFGGNNGELLQFHSMIWLIQDYIEHGYYIETEIAYKKCNTGKINWKKSIKQSNIWFNNGNIVFPSLVCNKAMIDESRIITQIYKACLSYSVKNIGFIYGINQTEHSPYDISKDKEFIVYYLTNELNNTNRDYKKTLLHHLITIVTNQNNKERSKGYSIYDSEFEYVFEFLVNHVFGTEDAKKFYNTYSYYIPNQISSSKLRPDTITKDIVTNTYYIIDAKYYNFGYTNKPSDLPPSSSISKQISYNHYLSDNLPEIEKGKYHIKSIFVLPYASTIPSEYVKYIGYAKRDGDTSKTNNIDDNVAICLVDLKELINTYLTNSKNLTPSILINSLK